MADKNKVLPASYTVCLYVRLSVEDSDLLDSPVKDESGSITAQRQLIRDYLKARPEFSRCRIIERCDDGFSGTHFDTRPACTEMIEMAKRSEIDCIIVKDFSRFGRNYVELGDYLEQLFPFLGVRFISVNDGYDSADLQEGETAGLSVAFQNLIYDYYSKELSKKEKLSHRQRVEHGKYSASYALYGYRKASDDKHRIEVYDDEADIVREIFDMKLSGLKLSDIARNLNNRQVPCPVVKILENHNKSDWFGIEGGFVWTASSVYHILTNEQYTGTLVALKSGCIEPGGKCVKRPKSEWLRVEGAHDAIISKEDFQKVQGSIRGCEHKKSAKRGVFQCGYCGRKLTDQKKSGSMRCYRGQLSGDERCMKVTMDNRLANEAVLMAIQQKVQAYLDAKERRRNASESRDIEAEISSVERAMQAEKKAWMKMYDEYADGKLGKQDFLAFKQEYDATLRNLEESMAELQRQKKVRDMEESSELEDPDAVLDAAELSQEILDTFDECVEVFEDNRLDIHWRFDPE